VINPVAGNVGQALPWLTPQPLRTWLGGAGISIGTRPFDVADRAYGLTLTDLLILRNGDGPVPEGCYWEQYRNQ
jgi:hypothetical protein